MKMTTQKMGSKVEGIQNTVATAMNKPKMES